MLFLFVEFVPFGIYYRWQDLSSYHISKCSYRPKLTILSYFPLCLPFINKLTIATKTNINKQAKAEKHNKYVVQENVVLGSSMIGLPLVIAVTERHMPGIEPVPLGWHTS